MRMQSKKEASNGKVSGPPASDEDRSDEALIALVAAHQQEALNPLYRRYAPLIFHLAYQTLDAAAAEEIVQDVFLAIWNKGETFDPARGRFRPWLLQIAHFRILNELRRRSRRPQLDPSMTDEALETLSASAEQEPIEAAWNSYRREAIRAAVDKLPAPQRQALSLAFFEDLSHDQVARALDLPLGTVKTRIRSAMLALRNNLAPLGIATVLLAVLAVAGIRFQMQLAAQQRDERALVMVTASDVTSIHIPAAPGQPSQIHGSYRGKPGTPLAVVAIDKFPPAPAGKTYQVWLLHKGSWMSLGTLTPDANGSAVLIGEGPELTALPEAIQVTVEPAGGSSAPSGPVIIAWPAK